ncbi:hypothetical protein L1987_38626 [Smallanthus sonchifolius]|uniref:Uncharacterized protein n=1 Tax=Smallanthus sonchifolius TaxID=185202 RepID=A0ACB9HLI1_9ASTR|nr:hypothetical protein L1987_38626 [Smallanthus sonchifolius]
MEQMYGFHSMFDYTPPESFSLPEYHADLSTSVGKFYGSLPAAAASITTEAVSVAATSDQYLLPRRRSNQQREDHLVDACDDDTIKAKIASHPLYPKLLDAFIDCRKLGAPPEVACCFKEIRGVCMRNAVVSACLGTDPELDDFMETYIEVLVKFKSDLARPFDEATVFLNNIEKQLSNLCKEEVELEMNGGDENEMNMEEQGLKDRLLRKFGGHMSSLKHEFSKKKKKGKLPIEARKALLQWWDSHYQWPYPTEVDKILLAESTGLDQKQINNWFINQRKRHWKPSENMQLAMMGGFSGQDFYDD